MIKFQKLRREVSDRVESEEKYWESLNEVAKNFGSDFGEYLGLVDNQALDHEGRPIGIINVGRMNNGRFERCAPWTHERDGKYLIFHLYLNLPGESNLEAQLTVALKIIIHKPDVYGYELNIRSSSMTYETTCEIRNDKFDLTPFFDELFHEIETKIDLQSL